MIVDENDAYQIVEMAMVDSEWNEKTYSVSSELLDGVSVAFPVIYLHKLVRSHWYDSVRCRRCTIC